MPPRHHKQQTGIKQVDALLTVSAGSLPQRGHPECPRTVGLLLSIFTAGPLWVWMLLVAAIIGAFWGAAFGFIAHASTRGQRDFSSVQALEAQRYDVYVAAQHAAQAARFVPGSRVDDSGAPRTP